MSVLAKQIPLKVYWQTSFEETLAAKKVSAHFSNQSIPEGVKALLSNVNYVIKGSGTKDSPVEIWLFAYTGVSSISTLTAVPSIESVPEDQDEVIHWASMGPGELRQIALTSKRSEVRERALIHLGEHRETPENLQVLVQSLQDKTLAVRRTALEELNTMDGVPLQPLAAMVLEEPNAELQREALAVLVHKFGMGAQPALETMQEQGRPEIRTYARQLLQYLEGKH
jgi:hypothetical protein